MLADQAPDLQNVLQQAHDDAKVGYPILDGAVITSDRLRQKTTSAQGKTVGQWYSLAPNGFPLWRCTPPPPTGCPPWLTAATTALESGLHTPKQPPGNQALVLAEAHNGRTHITGTTAMSHDDRGCSPWPRCARSPAR